jgi:hypothetical protein
MNRVDYETQVRALRRKLEKAASRGALAEMLARLALLPSLLGGENADCMRRRGANQLEEARIYETIAASRRANGRLSEIRADAEKLLFKVDPTGRAGRRVIFSDGEPR